VKKALLALADGTVFEGTALGFDGETVGELVFNTAMTGYQEILTDPSYHGQIVTMTSPLIGNYGVTPEDVESRRVWAAGFVVKECSRVSSNWRARQTLDEYFRRAKIVAIEGLDTRALTRHLRDHGSQQGVITHQDFDQARAVQKAREAPDILGRDLVADVTCAQPYEWMEGTGAWRPVSGSQGIGQAEGGPARSNGSARHHVVVYDFGVKQNILRCLVDLGCAVTVVPASTPAERVLALKPHGVLLSNGPGDPEGVPYAARTTQQLIGTVPVFGICLGHQILALALGLKTYKLKFGHHGGNHPVLDLRSRAVTITSQNHNFSVTLPPAPEGSAPADGRVVKTALGAVRLTHTSLNDESVEGLASLDHPVMSVQYHPEASPGPHDAAGWFEDFSRLMEKAHA
jgi:carbamoyl-phosphate synthase small subunit